MADTTSGAPAPASPFFSPAPDQSTVSLIEVTVQSVTPKPDGSLLLSVVSGNVSFVVTIYNLPGRPDYKPRDRLILEYPKGQTPLIDYTAGYHAGAVTTVPQPTPTKRETMNAIATITMTSLELVDYINSERKANAEKVGAEFPSKDHPELRHDNFMAKVPEVLKEAAPKFLGTAFYTNGTGAQVERKIYTFPKREACLMAMSYSYELQAKVFDRMTALEQQALGNTANTEKAELKNPTSILPVAKDFTNAFRIARLIGCDRNASAISANNYVYQTTGTNVMSLLGLTHLESDKQALFFNVSDLQTGISGVKMNKMLAAANLQTNADGCWIPTEAATKFCRIFDTGKRHSNGTPVQQVKWSKDVLGQLSIAEAA